MCSVIHLIHYFINLNDVLGELVQDLNTNMITLID